MKVCWGKHHFDGPSKGSMTIGVFDGLHLGHQKLIHKTVELARQTRLPSILYSFHPHPAEILNQGVHRLFPIEDMIEQAEFLGLDYFVVENFSEKFSKLSDEIFFDQYIYKTFKPSAIIVGQDFRFGFKKKGGVEKLKDWQNQYQFQLKIIEPVKIMSKTISSSLLRQAYEDCDFPFIHRLLGRPFSIKAEVVKGKGRKLNFPTANLRTSSLLPKQGVYICQMEVKNKSFQAVMNVGTCPTFENISPVITAEVHIIEPFSFNLKEEKVEVAVLSYLRSEQKFNNPHELTQAIHCDIEKAKKYFST